MEIHGFIAVCHWTPSDAIREDLVRHTGLLLVPSAPEMRKTASVGESDDRKPVERSRAVAPRGT